MEILLDIPLHPLKEVNDITLSDGPRIEVKSDGELTKPSENVAPKIFLKFTITTFLVMRKLIEDSDKRAKKKE